MDKISFCGFSRNEPFPRVSQNFMEDRQTNLLTRLKMSLKRSLKWRLLMFAYAATFSKAYTYQKYNKHFVQHGKMDLHYVS